MLLPEFHNKYDRLTDAEKRIADTILAAPREVTQKSVKELATEAG